MRTVIVIIISTVVCIGAQAQIQFSAGPGAGVSYAIHLAPNDAHFYQLNPLVSSQVDMQFSRRLGLLVWIDFYSDLSAGLKDNDYTYSLAYASLAPTLKFCIPGSPFYVYGGPGFGFKTRGTATGALYGVSEYVEDIGGMNIRADFRLGAGYDFFLTNRLTLSPFAGFNIGLTEVVRNSDWRVSALQAGAVVRYNLH